MRLKLLVLCNLRIIFTIIRIPSDKTCPQKRKRGLLPGMNQAKSPAKRDNPIKSVQGYPIRSMENRFANPPVKSPQTRMKPKKSGLDIESVQATCDVSTKRSVNAGCLHQKCSFWLGFISLLKLLVAILKNTLRVSHGSDIVTRLLQPNSF